MERVQLTLEGGDRRRVQQSGGHGAIGRGAPLLHEGSDRDKRIANLQRLLEQVE